MLTVTVTINLKLITSNDIIQMLIYGFINPRELQEGMTTHWDRPFCGQGPKILKL